MRRKVTYIYERETWPEFRWDGEVVSAELARVRHTQGRLLGRMEGLGFALRAEASAAALVSDVVQSSAIEGEKLDVAEVRSSIARKLGLEAGGVRVGRDVEGVVQMMLDATQRYEAALTKERLFEWHASLFPTGRNAMVEITVGAWRPASAGPMQVVSGPIGREKVHFEAPGAGVLDREMRAFVKWFNASPAGLDPVIRAAIAHLWFVTVHPFEDGNGRIARAIADMALARADGTKERFYSMSSQIAAERKAYYAALETAQRGDVDITGWVTWFLGCLGRAIAGAGETSGAVLRKAAMWERINVRPVNERQRAVINRMLDGFKGFISTSKYAVLAKCSPDTALRDIGELVERGILVRNEGGGRSTSYRLGEAEAVR